MVDYRAYVQHASDLIHSDPSFSAFPTYLAVLFIKGFNFLIFDFICNPGHVPTTKTGRPRPYRRAREGLLATPEGEGEEGIQDTLDVFKFKSMRPRSLIKGDKLGQRFFLPISKVSMRVPWYAWLDTEDPLRCDI